MRKNLIATALLVPLVLVGASACSGKKSGTIKGTFPYCSYSRVNGGVLVHSGQSDPCVVDDTTGAHTRGFTGSSVVPQRTATRTPLLPKGTKRPSVFKR